MKLAISGKGGAGKTTLAAALTLLIAKRGSQVLALDADPAANLANALGIPEAAQQQIIPLSEHKALIEERTGAKVKEYGQMFKLNPQVSDISEKFAYLHQGAALLVLGAVQSGGGGCACPESVLIRALVSDLVLFKDQALVIDMEAGIEHLGRGTARGVDTMLIVVEPSKSSVDCARRIMRMAAEIGLRDLQLAANKVRSREDEEFLTQSFPDLELFAAIPWDEDIRRGDTAAGSVLDGLNQGLSRFLPTFSRGLNYERKLLPSQTAE